MTGIQLSELQDNLARDLGVSGPGAIHEAITRLPHDTLAALVMVNVMKRAHDLGQANA